MLFKLQPERLDLHGPDGNLPAYRVFPGSHRVRHHLQSLFDIPARHLPVPMESFKLPENYLTATTAANIIPSTSGNIGSVPLKPLPPRCERRASRKSNFFHMNEGIPIHGVGQEERRRQGQGFVLSFGITVRQAYLCLDWIAVTEAGGTGGRETQGSGGGKSRRGVKGTFFIRSNPYDNQPFNPLTVTQ